MKLKHVLTTTAALITLAACQSEPEFEIRGQIDGAKTDTWLYLDALGYGSVATLDSIELDKDGDFAFVHSAPKEPSFYQLRLDDQRITLAIDSTEQVSIIASATSLARDYQVSGSATNDSIRTISVLRDLTDSNLTDTSRAALRERAQHMILHDLSNSASYFALFMQVGDTPLFDPSVRTDAKLYASVANSLLYTHPNSERTKRLLPYAEKAMRSTRSKETIQAAYDKLPINEIGFIDIKLPGIDDKEVLLSDYAKGSYTLIDFTDYDIEISPIHNMKIMELHQKYNKALRIYQISIEQDKYLWRSRAAQLPWQCVWENGSTYSKSLQNYNVQGIPTAFLIDPEGNIVARIEDDNTLGKVIKEALK